MITADQDFAIGQRDDRRVTEAGPRPGRPSAAAGLVHHGPPGNLPEGQEDPDGEQVDRLPKPVAAMGDFSGCRLVSGGRTMTDSSDRAVDQAQTVIAAFASSEAGKSGLVQGDRKSVV